MNIGTLTIEMAANVARLSKDMDAARRTVERTFGSIEKDVARLKALLGNLFTGLSVAAFVGKLVDVQRQFDVLNSSLITVTGSSAAAAREFAWIKEFAATTPFQLAEVTEAFVKMKALGLDASQAALTSYGNTASAMGKSLNQMIEAVADAATGEFERLKEFGIRAKQQGDQVTLTFQGVSKTIGNNAAEITAYLQAIGNNEFAGAMAQRAQTLDGAISSLADTWDELFRTISQQSAGGLIYDSVQLASGAINDMITILNALNDATAENAKQTGAMKVIQEGIAIVFETVAVLGVNLKYVLMQIGREIGGIAAQASAILRGDFAQAGEIHRMMVADAEAARKEVDATTARILNARSAAQAATAANAAMVQSAPPASRAATTVASSAKTANDELEKFITRMNASEAGVETDFYKNLMMLRDGYNKGKLSLEEYMALAEKYIKQQRFYQDQVRESAAAEEERRKAEERATQEREKAIQSAEEMVEQIRFETDALKMTNTEREIAIKLRELERNGIKAGSAEYEEYARRIRDAVVSKEAVEASIEQQREVAREWQRTAESIERSLTDALLRGFESGKDFARNLRDTVANMFKTLVLRPVVQAVVVPVAGGITGALGLPGVASAAETVGHASGVSGVGNLFSGISTLSSALGLGLGAGFRSIAAAGIGGWLSAGTSLIGTGTLGGIGAGLGLLGGPIGMAASLLGLGGGAIKGLFGRKLKDYGIEGTFGDDGFTGNAYKFYKGGLFRSNKTKRRPLDPKLDRALDQQFMAIKTNVLGLGKVLGVAGTALDGFRQSIKLSFKGLNEQQIQEKLNEVFNGLGESMARSILGASAVAGDAFIKEGETAQQALVRLAGSLQAVNGAIDLLGGNLLEASLASGDLASKIVEAFGGLDQFSSAVQTYYANFYTEQERLAKAVESMGKAFAGLGLTMPKTKAEFRALVEAQDITTESGRKTLAALLNLSGAFAEIADASQKALIEDARTATDAAYSALERAIDAQRTSVTAMRDAAREQVDSVTAVFDVLQSNIEELYDEAASTSAMSAAAGHAFIAQALATARSTGYLPDSDELSQAIRAARGGLDSGRYASAFEAERDRLVLAGRLSQLREISGTQLTTAEQQLKVAEQQLESLDDQLATARAQLDAMRGVDQRVLSVEQAIRELNVAMAAELRALGGAAVHGFAAGGLHDGGVRMVGENGPEIEVTGPARYYSAGQTAAMLGGGAAVANEVRQLREENQAQARAMVQLQARVTRLLERWDGDGMPETRSVTA